MRDLGPFLRRLGRRVSWPWLLAVGVALPAALWRLESWVRERTAALAPDFESVSAAREDLDIVLAERRSLRDLVAADLERARQSTASLSRSRRVLFEGGLALAEEKRLLDKQWEIMTTYLLVDPAKDSVSIMRGDQIDKILPLAGARVRSVGDPMKSLPQLVTIVSKERYAHPERGKSELVDGRLDWEPPQVGASARARALGADVLFTREGLVIHGPPLDQTEHEAYPHLCLSLPAATARALYARSFIGTKVLLRSETLLSPARP